MINIEHISIVKDWKLYHIIRN